MMKIIIIIIGYILNNFTIHIKKFIVSYRNIYNFKILKTNSYFEKKKY